MKILLTGSTSFLGSKFIELFGSKYSITGLSRTNPALSIDILDKNSLHNISRQLKPDILIHLAAIVDHHSDKALNENILGTRNLVDIASDQNIPIIFMSSESIYGGKESGEYTENDSYLPRSDYAKSKVESEKLIINSGTNYLILRGHRFIGINKNYSKPKQFPDTLKSLFEGEEVHLDSNKLFRPSFINHISDVIDHYIQNDLSEKLILNCVIEHTTTYYDLIISVAEKLRLNESLILSDGEETGWPDKSILLINKLKSLNYPYVSFEKMLDQIITDS